MTEVRRCAVLGSPVAHSLSPVLHRAAYAELGLPWSYDAIEVTEDTLPGFLEGLDPSWRGLSLTMPLKRAVLPLLDELGTHAATARAANTVVLDDGRRVGENTDVPGAVAALRDRGVGDVRTATVLGGGATATSTLLALAELGCERARLVVREPARATETVEAVQRHRAAPVVDVLRLDDVRPEPTDVLVSTVPAVAQDDRVLGLLEGSSAVFEVLYDPWPTPLAARALAAGLPLVGGLDLLVHQAVLQVELMTGVPTAPLETMRRAGEEALASRTPR